MDSIGPLPKSRLHNNRYILCCVDYASKWVEARAVPVLTSDQTCQFFMDTIARWGVPRVVCTDQGKEFQNTFNTLLQSMNIIHNQSSAYHPQGNGQAEAVVKAVTRGLQRAVGSNPLCWDEKLSLVLLGLRAAKHASTGFSPHYVLTGREPVMPADRAMLPNPESDTHLGDSSDTSVPRRASLAAAAAAGAPSPSNVLDPGTQQLLQQRAARHGAIQNQLRNNILKAQEKQKKDYKRKYHSTDPAEYMPEGCLVYLQARKRSKLDSPVEGPYRLIAYLEGHSEAILEDQNRKRWTTTVSRLSPYTVQ
jgi:hypothetical protein